MRIRTARHFATAVRLVVIAGLSFTLHPRAALADAATLPTNFADQLLSGGLDLPTGIAEVPDPQGPLPRRALFVEQISGNVMLYAGGTVYLVGNVPGISTDGGERGLLGIALDPRWPTKPYVYVQCTDQRSGNFVTISRYTLMGDYTYANDGLLQFVPNSRYDLRADFPDQQSNHNGGTLRFGTDGMLYSSLGDDASNCPAQDITVAVGKILRLDVSRLPDGPGGPAPYALLAPADNPFASNADSIAKLVWAEGLRNPFRFHVDSKTGVLVIGDVGLDTWEEVDIATAGGMDFGWPVYEGPAPYLACGGTPPAPYTAPITYYPHPDGEAIIGGPRYRRPATPTARFPAEYDGDIFFLDYYTGFLRRVKQSGTTWAPASAPGQPDASDWGTGMYDVSDLVEFSDGSMWYCRQYLSGASSGELRRIVYTGSASVGAPQPRSLALSAPSPNPSRGASTIAWTQPADGAVTLAIWSASGRRVRTLVPGDTYAAGPQTIAWDGRDDHGERVGAGVYFVRLTAAGENRQGRMVRLP